MFFSLKLNYATKYLDDLESKKAAIKSCMSKVNQYLHCLVETRDSILTMSVRQHLYENLKPDFTMLNRIEGVSEDDALPKQGEKS